MTDKQTVILTRQARYLGDLSAQLSQQGFQTTHIPLLEISALSSDELQQLIASPDQYSDIVVVSPNALRILLAQFSAEQLSKNKCRWFAMGQETTKQLQQVGINNIVSPSEANGAKALLDLPQLQDLSGRTIAIIRGQQGLDWPAEVMQQRGATVNSIKCYRQDLPADSLDKLTTLLANNHHIDAVFFHSAQALLHWQQFFPSTMLQSTNAPLNSYLAVVGSARIAEQWRKAMQNDRVVIADSPSNDDMLRCFVKYCKTTFNNSKNLHSQ